MIHLYKRCNILIIICFSNFKKLFSSLISQEGELNGDVAGEGETAAQEEENDE